MSLLEDTFILPEPPDVIGFESGVKVEVFFPEQPFGGVQVEGVADIPIQLEINTGAPVFSVFGRTGNIVPQPGDYSAFYAPAGATAPVTTVFGRLGAILANQSDYQAFYALKAAGIPLGGTTGQVLAKKTSTSLDTEWVTPPLVFDGKFTSLDFTGSNLTSILTRNFSDLQNRPTTLAGYGITDAQPLDADLTSIAALATTPFGRGGLIQADAAGFRTYIGAGTSSFDGAFASLTGKPTTLIGYGIVDAQPLDSDLSAISALATTSFGRGSLTQVDAAGFRTYIGAGTSSFDGTFASLTGKPTTLAGYGITDPIVLTSGSYPNPAWITSLAYSKLTGVPALEPALGNPSTNGFVLSSTTAGVRNWIAAGAGTVTTFSAGNLSPLFTTSVGTATTTPALSFVLASPAPILPAGGTTGQVLIKNSNANYDVSWADVVVP